jgi:hypothetical protein
MKEDDQNDEPAGTPPFVWDSNRSYAIGRAFAINVSSLKHCPSSYADYIPAHSKEDYRFQDGTPSP